MTEIKIGLTATAMETVLYTNIASALGSGNLSVYATPAMVALMESTIITKSNISGNNRYFFSIVCIYTFTGQYIICFVIALVLVITQCASWF